MNLKLSPQLGYNTNVRHKGKVYHIQTEDSGLQHPHIITHLFADGGRIVASRKTSYAEHVSSPTYVAIVKKLMQDQHKAMFIALRDGEYDDEPAGIAPTPFAGLPLPQSQAPVVPAEAAEAADALAAIDIVVDDAIPVAEVASDVVPPPVRDIPEIDVGVLERAAAARERESLVSPVPRPSATPPFPLRRPASSAAGRYGTTHPPKAVTRTRTRKPSQSKRPSQPAPKSIFGDDLVSEKSLDEVILSYLSDDVEEKS